jgi:uncharacterized protein (AIM24 family)
MVLGGSGFFIDKFRASDGDALVWLHGHGNVFLVQLDDGEQLDVEAGAWLYKDPTVSLEAVTMGLKTGIVGGGPCVLFDGNTYSSLSAARKR